MEISFDKRTEQEQTIHELQEQLRHEIAERERWAQALHDAINQSLFSAGLIAEVLPRLWDRDQEAARRAIEDLRRLTFGAMAEMRVLLMDLHDSLVTETDLSDLLRLLGNMTAGRLNIPVAVDPHGEGTIPPDVQASLYQTAKEVLSRLSERGKAQEIRIELSKAPSSCEICLYAYGDTLDFLFHPEQSEEFRTLLERSEALGIQIELRNQANGLSEAVIRWKKHL